MIATVAQIAVKNTYYTLSYFKITIDSQLLKKKKKY